MFIKARSMSASCAATMNKEPKKWEAVMSEQEAYSEGYNEILKTYIGLLKYANFWNIPFILINSNLKIVFL